MFAASKEGFEKLAGEAQTLPIPSRRVALAVRPWHGEGRSRFLAAARPHVQKIAGPPCACRC